MKTNKIHHENFNLKYSPEEFLSKTITAKSGLVFLKIFIPPRFYGAYLVFLPSGEPIGAIDKDAAEMVKSIHGQKVGEIIHDIEKKIDGVAFERLISLLEAGIIVFGKTKPELHWIEPDKKDGTRHSGKSSSLFIEYFYNYFGQVFLKGSPLIDSNTSFLSILSKYFPKDPRLVCLDAGCGSGFYSAALASGGNHVYACDINIGRVQEAAAQAKGYEKIIPVKCSLENVSISTNSIDFAMCNFVLEHVADPFKVLNELIRVLKPGGVLLLAFPSLNVRDIIGSWFYGEVPSLNFEHLRSYGLIPRTHPWCEPTLDTLKYLSENGIAVSTVEGINIDIGLFEPWATLVHSYMANLGQSFSTTWPWNCMGQQTVIFGRCIK